MRDFSAFEDKKSNNGRLIKMEWDFDKQITTIIIIAIIMFGLFFIALAIGTWNFKYTLNLNMDNNTLEAVKSIDWKNITK